jgi:hypothetical protein
MVGKDIYTNCGTVGLTEWPDGATRVARDTQWVSRADGYPDGCPTEGARVPDGEREWPDGGLDGCPTEGGVSRGGPTAGLGGLGGWPNEGLYKCRWPSFLGTLFLRPVAPTRNAGAQGANE